MLSWAVAKLGYMPAARLVRAALPHMAAARLPAVQVRAWAVALDGQGANHPAAACVGVSDPAGGRLCCNTVAKLLHNAGQRGC